MQKKAGKGYPKDPYLRLSVQPTMMFVDEAIPNGLVIVGSEAIEDVEGEHEAKEPKKDERPIDITPAWELSSI